MVVWVSVTGWASDAWVDSVVSVQGGLTGSVLAREEAEVYVAEAPDDAFVQLGDGTVLVLAFDDNLAYPDGTVSPDLRIHTYDTLFPAAARVEVSADGIAWVELAGPAANDPARTCGAAPELWCIYDDLPESFVDLDLDVAGLPVVRFVRLSDRPGTIDGDTTYPELGFDLDAVEALRPGPLDDLCDDDGGAVSVASFGPSSWSADVASMDAALGVSVLEIEDFEDTTLLPGLSVEYLNTEGSWRSTLGAVDATFTSLPRVYDTREDWPGNAWDGPHALSNDIANDPWYDYPNSMTRYVVFHVEGGASTFGVGFGNFQAEVTDHVVLVDGVPVALAECQVGFVSGYEGRNLYLRIDAAPGDRFFSVAVDMGEAGIDGLVFDHVAIGRPAADTDGDGVADEDDNCVFVVNPDQVDLDGDGAGDACDDDDDGDGVRDDLDNCADYYNPGQEDADGDSLGDGCDGDDDNDAVDDAGDNCTGLAKSGSGRQRRRRRRGRL